MDDALSRALRVKDFFWILNEVEARAKQAQPNSVAFLNRWHDTLEAADVEDLAEIYSIGDHLARMNKFRVSDLALRLLTEQFDLLTYDIAFADILFIVKKNFPNEFPKAISQLVERINGATDDELVTEINVAMIISKTIFQIPELMEAALARVMAMDDEHLNGLECTRIVEALTKYQMGPVPRVSPFYNRGVEVAIKIFEAFEHLPPETLFESEYFQWNLRCPFMVDVNQHPKTRVISDDRITDVAMKLEVYVSQVGEDAIKSNDRFSNSRYGGKLDALQNYRTVLGDTRPREPPVNRPFKGDELESIVAFSDRALEESKKSEPDFLCTALDFQNMLEAGLADTVTHIVENYLLMPDSVFAEYRTSRVFVVLKEAFLGDPVALKRFEQEDIPDDSTLGQFREKLKRAFLGRETIYDGDGTGQIVSTLFDVDEILPRLYEEMFGEPISASASQVLGRELRGPNPFPES